MTVTQGEEEMKRFLIKLLNAVITARTEKADHVVAQQLWSVEFRHESFDYVLSMVRAGKIDDLATGDSL